MLLLSDSAILFALPRLEQHSHTHTQVHAETRVCVCVLWIMVACAFVWLSINSARSFQVNRKLLFIYPTHCAVFYADAAIKTAASLYCRLCHMPPSCAPLPPCQPGTWQAGNGNGNGRVPPGSNNCLNFQLKTVNFCPATREWCGDKGV